MTQGKIEHRLLDELERLFQREAFGIEVVLKRAQIGIPILNGFDSNQKYRAWLEKNRDRFFDIQSARADLARKFKLPISHSQWLEGYLLLGKKFKEFDTTTPFGMSYSRGWDKAGFACALEFDEDDECVNVKILPGASYRDVSKFVRDNKREIDEALKPFERRVKPIRVQTKKERDELVYACFKKGLLDRYGRDKTSDDVWLPDEVLKMDMDYRRKIIGEQIKLRK